MTDNKRPTPDELRNAQDATFTTGEGKAPELGVKTQMPRVVRIVRTGCQKMRRKMIPLRVT